jgi:hypothetical protein
MNSRLGMAAAALSLIGASFPSAARSITAGQPKRPAKSRYRVPDAAFAGAMRQYERLQAKAAANAQFYANVPPLSGPGPTARRAEVLAKKWEARAIARQVQKNVLDAYRIPRRQTYRKPPTVSYDVNVGPTVTLPEDFKGEGVNTISVGNPDGSQTTFVVPVGETAEESAELIASAIQTKTARKAKATGKTVTLGDAA